jgi:hypothetical protein
MVQDGNGLKLFETRGQEQEQSFHGKSRIGLFQTFFVGMNGLFEPQIEERQLRAHVMETSSIHGMGGMKKSQILEVQVVPGVQSNPHLRATRAASRKGAHASSGFFGNIVA